MRCDRSSPFPFRPLLGLRFLDWVPPRNVPRTLRGTEPRRAERIGDDHTVASGTTENLFGDPSFISIRSKLSNRDESSLNVSSSGSGDGRFSRPDLGVKEWGVGHPRPTRS